MPSTKKIPPRRPTPAPRTAAFTRQYEKDFRGLIHSGRYNMARLKEAMALLVANAGPLPPEWRDHALLGRWSKEGHRELHVEGDLLLIYRFSSDGTEVLFTRAGTHSQLF